MIKTYAFAYGAVLLTYLVMDGIWLGLVAKDSYTQAMAGLMREHYPIWPWVVFYTLYSAAIVYLVIKPNLSSGWLAVLCAGAVLGLAAYGAYNLTNYALINHWPLSITFKDWLWGMFVTSVSSLAGYHAAKWVL